MPSKKELAIAGLYDGIYLFYGTINSLLTLGLDSYWRARAANIAKTSSRAGAAALDVCCGTGDFSLALKRVFKGQITLTGADLSETMLTAARKKNTGITFVRAEAKELPFPEGSFDLVTISFAARNLNIDRDLMLAALRECRRVLKPGGLFINLETTRPESPLLGFFMRAYVNLAIGVLHRLSPESSPAYSFLKTTILSFYSAAEFSTLLQEAGFVSPSARILCPGAVAVHTARRQ